MNDEIIIPGDIPETQVMMQALIDKGIDPARVKIRLLGDVHCAITRDLEALSEPTQLGWSDDTHDKAHQNKGEKKRNKANRWR
jgi:hypothetical protein